MCVCCFTVGPCGHPWPAHCPWCEGQTRAWNLKKSLCGCMLKCVRYIQFQCSFYFIFKIRRLWFTPGFLPTSRTNWLLLLVYHLCHSWICYFVLLCVMFSVIILFLNRGLLYHVCCTTFFLVCLKLFHGWPDLDARRPLWQQSGFTWREWSYSFTSFLPGDGAVTLLTLIYGP